MKFGSHESKSWANQIWPKIHFWGYFVTIGDDSLNWFGCVIGNSAVVSKMRPNSQMSRSQPDKIWRHTEQQLRIDFFLVLRKSVWCKFVHTNLTSWKIFLLHKTNSTCIFSLIAFIITPVNKCSLPLRQLMLLCYLLVNYESVSWRVFLSFADRNKSWFNRCICWTPLCWTRKPFLWAAVFLSCH